MARIRTIKPEFWQDERLAALPFHARLLYIGLWTIADDEGRFRANPLFVKAQVFPYDLEVNVVAGMVELERMKRIILYTADGEAIGWIPRFSEHQRIDKPKPSRLPPPPEAGLVQDESKTDPGFIQDASKIDPGRKGREGNGREGKGSTPIPPATKPPPPGCLRDRMEAAWRAAKGAEYAWAFEDDNAMRPLLQRGGEAEVLARWTRAIKWVGYPTCNAVKDLVRHWNAYVKDQPTKATPPGDRPRL